MTLYRQLLIFIIVLLLVLFACSWLVKLQSTRIFIEDQLESHAQDTATSLGLSISPHLSDDDRATIETMISAVFDRGYYSRIALEDLDGKVIIERRLEVVISDVPAWFIKLIELKTPEARTLVSSGWRQMGALNVKSHPGYAYKALWKATSDMGKVYGIAGLLVLIFGAGGLRLLLRPLHRIEEQAENLSRRQYTFQEQLPRTRELRSVVVAMNTMTSKVKEMFDEQAGVADRLRKNAYTDELTGLGNRRYLQGQVAALAGEGNDLVAGALLLIQACDLQEINRKKGFQYGDQLLQRIAEKLRETTGHLHRAALAHLSGGTFAILLTDVSHAESKRIAKKLADDLASLADEGEGLAGNIGHVGGVSFVNATSFGQLLAEADHSLTLAQAEGPNRWRLDALTAETAKMPQGQMEWKRMLDEVLSERAITVFRQSVFAASGTERILHVELFSRILLSDGQAMSAGVFIPLAIKSHCIAAVDQMVLEKALEVDWRSLGVEEVAINISSASFREPSFSGWVLNRLGRLNSHDLRIVFEFVEFAAIRDLATIQTFADEVKKRGHAIAFDHFGQSFANFGYLKSLQPKYVKIDKGFTDELRSGESDGSFFIGALTGVAHSLDILVVAEGVENKEQAEMLRALNVDGMQGFMLDQPRPVVV